MASDTVFGAAFCTIAVGGVVVDPADPAWPAATRALLPEVAGAAGALPAFATMAAIRARMGNALETSTSAACVKKERALTKALGKDGAIYLDQSPRI